MTSLEYVTELDCIDKNIYQIGRYQSTFVLEIPARK
jgi:hypothetical protein